MRFACVLCCSVAILVVTNCGATEPGNLLYKDSVPVPQNALNHRFRRHSVLGGTYQFSLADDKKSKSARGHSKHRKGKGRKKKPNDQGLSIEILGTKHRFVIGGDEGKEEEDSKEHHHDTSWNKNLKSHGAAAEHQNLPAPSTHSGRRAPHVSPTTVVPSQESSKMGLVTQAVSLGTSVTPDTVSTAEGSNSTVAPLQESSMIDVTTQVVSLETTTTPDTASTPEESNSTVAPLQESSTIGVTIQVALSETTATNNAASTSEISDSTVVQSQESSTVGVTTQIGSLESTAAPDAAVSTTEGSNATASESDNLTGAQTLTKSGSRSLGRAEGGSLSLADAGTGSRYLIGDDLGSFKNFDDKTSGKFDQNTHSNVDFTKNVSPQRPSAFPDLKQEWSLPKQPIYSQSSDSIQRKYSNIQTPSSQQSHPLWEDARHPANSFATPERQSAYDLYVQMLREAPDTSQGHAAFLGESLNHKPTFSTSTQDKLYRPSDLDSQQNYQFPSHLSPNTTSTFHEVAHHTHTYDDEDPAFG